MSAANAQWLRMEANCRTIWGNNCDYDFNVETDDYLHYMADVKKDFGLEFGPPLTMTALCPSSEAAWRELDRMLDLMATEVKRGMPMTKEEKLIAFGGPKGQHR
jgi:hypothetical protein